MVCRTPILCRLGKMKYETVSLTELSNDPKNSRTHNERNIDAIVASLKKFSSPEKCGGKYKIPDSVIRIARRPNTIKHPAQFPVALPLFLMDCWDGSVLDPFLGSGTTLIACEQLDRKCYGMEISPNYCDVIVKRWETLTGKKATLA